MKPVGVIDYSFCYPGKDAKGGDLLTIKGAYLYVRGPGECEFKKVAETAFPNITFSHPVFTDGVYVLKHTVKGQCGESEASDEVVAVVDTTPSEKPKAGKAVVSCYK